MEGLGRFLLLIFILTQAASHPATKTALRLGSMSKPHDKQRQPMVVIIDPYKHYSQFLNRLRKDQQEQREEEEREDPKEDAKSLLYSYLRTSPDDNADPEVENHKDILRSALRARCSKVSLCVLKCPPKRPSCPSGCQQAFDAANLCEPPKKKMRKVKVTYEYECDASSDECRGANGKTMPPRWRMRH